MKYIRTKDGIEKIDKGWELFFNDHVTNKQADTIEELIDEYVVVEDKSHNIPSYLEEALDRFFQKLDGELSENYHIEIYGAIWTSKGLIYVAKMNEKGELELL